MLTRAELDGLDVVVVVASADGTAPLVPDDLAGITREQNVDLQQNVMTAVLLLEVLRQALRRPGGLVIGLGSIGAQLGSGYGASKAALHAWIFWRAEDLGAGGVTANLALPGYVPHTEFLGDRVTPECDGVRVARSLVGRAGTSAESAACIESLASPDAGYITAPLLGAKGRMVLGS